jgi:hypothetical protein
MLRTTLDIDDDVLQAAKELATQEGSTAGRVISVLARRGLVAPEKTAEPLQTMRGNVPLLPSRGEVVTLEHVRQLMDQEGM